MEQRTQMHDPLARTAMWWLPEPVEGAGWRGVKGSKGEKIGTTVIT